MHNAPEPRPIPATIGTVFGGLRGADRRDGFTVSLAFSSRVIAALTAVLLIIRLRRSSEPVSGSARPIFKRKAYHIAVVAEILAIYAASALLSRFGWQSYFLQAAGVIVGLHFVGL